MMVTDDTVYVIGHTDIDWHRTLWLGDAYFGDKIDADGKGVVGQEKGETEMTWCICSFVFSGFISVLQLLFVFVVFLWWFLNLTPKRYHVRWLLLILNDPKGFSFWGCNFYITNHLINRKPVVVFTSIFFFFFLSINIFNISCIKL